MHVGTKDPGCWQFQCIWSSCVWCNRLFRYWNWESVALAERTQHFTTACIVYTLYLSMDSQETTNYINTNSFTKRALLWACMSLCMHSLTWWELIKIFMYGIHIIKCAPESLYEYIIYNWSIISSNCMHPSSSLVEYSILVSQHNLKPVRRHWNTCYVYPSLVSWLLGSMTGETRTIWYKRETKRW